MSNHNNQLNDAEVLTGNQFRRELEDITRFVESEVRDMFTINEMTRQQMFNRVLGGDRSTIDDDCGYLTTEQISIDRLYELWKRDPIARRIVNLWSTESWRKAPDLYDTEDEKKESDFEKAFEDVCRSINGISWADGETLQTQFWNVLLTADTLSGIGNYSVIVLGLNDGKSLSEPVDGWSDEDLDREPDKLSTNAEEVKSKPKRTGKPLKLLYMRPYSHYRCRILEWETDTTHPRYGQPKTYSIKSNDSRTGSIDVGQPLGSCDVHWTRVIHLTPWSDESPVIADSKLLVTMDRLWDLKKVYGGGGEGFWQGALPGIKMEPANNEVQLTSDSVKDMRGALEDYITRTKRFLASDSMKIGTIAPSVVDPTAHLGSIIEAVCIVEGVPVRVFKGSERGELSSSQDQTSFDDRCATRQQMVIKPRIIAPVIDRLIELRVLPEPEKGGWKVKFPGLKEKTESEKMQVAGAVTKALSDYIKGGLSDLITPTDYLVKILDFDKDEVDEILENAMQEAEEKAEEEPQAPPQAPPQPGGPNNGQTQAVAGPPAKTQAPNQAPQAGAGRGTPAPPTEAGQAAAATAGQRNGVKAPPNDQKPTQNPPGARSKKKPANQSLPTGNVLEGEPASTVNVSGCGAGGGKGRPGFQPGNKCAKGKGGKHNLPKGKWKLLEAGTPEFEHHREELFTLIDNAYKDIGGHIKITSPASLDRYRYWLVQDMDDDPAIDVALFGRGEFGIKGGGGGHDGSKDAIAMYKNTSAQLRKGETVGGASNWWGEVSDKLAYAVLKRGAPAVTDPKIAAKLLAGDKYVWHGEHPDPTAPDVFRNAKGWYTKDFGSGGKHTKIITGIPDFKSTDPTTNEFEQDVDFWKDLEAFLNRGFLGTNANCGIGPGGFQPGNKCAKGRGGRKGSIKPASVKYWPNKEEVVESVSDMVGKPVSEQDMLKLFSATDGADVAIEVGDFESVTCDVVGPGYRAYREFGENMSGEFALYNAGLEVKKDSQGKGLGTKLLTNQVAACEKLGINSIELTASQGKDRSNENNGGYTWARLGFDGPLPKSAKQALNDNKNLPFWLSDASTVHELISRPGGREWWIDNATTFEGKFDTRKGSVSRRILDKYNHEKENERKAQSGTTTNADEIGQQTLGQSLGRYRKGGDGTTGTYEGGFGTTRSFVGLNTNANCGIGSGGFQPGNKCARSKKQVAADVKFNKLMESKSPADRKAFTAARKDGIAIPPAWTEVTYHGKNKDIRAEGRDAKGRRQRTEDPEYRARLSKKNNARISRDLTPRMDNVRNQLREGAKSGNEEDKVLYVITETGFRIGSTRNTKAAKQAYGASTLKGEHVKVNGSKVTFDYPGKKGVRQLHTIDDPVIAGMLSNVKPGERIFNTNGNKIRNRWKNSYNGKKVHDIRHAVATEKALKGISARVPPKPKNAKERKKLMKEIGTEVASVLGNNASQTLGTYIDPAIWDNI